MPQELVVELGRGALSAALLLSGPALAVALGVGLLISVLQAVTQIQEQTLAFVGKLVAVSAILFLLLPWLLQVAVRYTAEILRSIPTLVA